MTMNLDFNDLEKFLAYLKNQEATTIHAAFREISTEPTGQLGLASIAYRATLSARTGDCIATCGIILAQTDAATLAVPQEAQDLYLAMVVRFGAIVANLADQGFHVEHPSVQSFPG